MRALATLIRLHKQALDDNRARLAGLESESAALYARAERLDAEYESEARVAAASYEAGQAFPAFADRVSAEHQALDREIASLDASIDEAGEAVAAAYRDLKKYEVTRDRRERREKDTEARRDRAYLDEIGLTVHRRRPAD